MTNHLPLDIINEIKTFLIPPSNRIIFTTVSSNCYVSSYSFSSYSSRYEKAYIGNKMVQNDRGMFLSRISKKNNKHRYYVTTEIIDTIEVEYNDSVIEMDYYEYKSKFVGKNIDDALLHLILLV
jgi:hypothetical protein